MFWLNRRAFYDEKFNLKNKHPKGDIKPSEHYELWSKIWKRKDNDDKNGSIDKLINTFKINNEQKTLSITSYELSLIIKNLPLWKAPGNDGIFNFFIKYLTSTHSHLLNIFNEFIQNNSKIPNELFLGRTILIPKDNAKSVNDYRPITCLSNIYKLYTRILMTRLSTHIQNNNLISINQAGAVPKIHAAKEQYILNKAIITQMEDRRCVGYIDIKKAYDTIDRKILIKILETSKTPKEIIDFIKLADVHWATILHLNSKPIGKAKLERGIIQGDSLSPLLFTLIMELITRDLNLNDKNHIEFNTGIENIKINHLLYVDDI
ncbi:LINE-1 retrotransposable element ORF2 protein [Dictyocoela muelleri]|nr:LINE-1 retrotransposable element ORF2 protein [Dictyocoela muelleri]